MPRVFPRGSLQVSVSWLVLGSAFLTGFGYRRLFRSSCPRDRELQGLSSGPGSGCCTLLPHLLRTPEPWALGCLASSHQAHTHLLKVVSLCWTTLALKAIESNRKGTRLQAAVSVHPTVRHCFLGVQRRAALHTVLRPTEDGPAPHTALQLMEGGPAPHTALRPAEGGPATCLHAHGTRGLQKVHRKCVS